VDIHPEALSYLMKRKPPEREREARMPTGQLAEEAIPMRSEKVLLCRLVELGLPVTNREEALNAIIQFAVNLVQSLHDSPVSQLDSVSQST
jgi:hypothetical protein